MQAQGHRNGDELCTHGLSWPNYFTDLFNFTVKLESNEIWNNESIKLLFIKAVQSSTSNKIASLGLGTKPSQWQQNHEQHATYLQTSSKYEIGQINLVQHYDSWL